MYGWLFRHLPGPLWVRVVTTIVLIAALIMVLFGWVFPAIAPYMPFNDGLVGAAGTLDPGPAAGALDPGPAAGAVDPAPATEELDPAPAPGSSTPA